MIPWHLGTLHPFEQVLTIVLAFGPFILLGIVIVIQRRKDAREEAEEAAAARETDRVTPPEGD
ncbi:hypothetical protein [Nocardioides sp. MH1]|uniref:hypothetical protein n=1 Tax=Nocardioides sp. MH1 TaxID=3242490 RepID=UPI003520369E